MEILRQIETSRERPTLPAGVRILLVDDTPDTLLIFGHILKLAGAVTQQATSAAEAVAQVISSPPNLILLDLQLPDMDGQATVGEIRAVGFLGPIVALSASAVPGVRESCLRAGFAAYLGKPVDFAELIATVSKVLDETCAA